MTWYTGFYGTWKDANGVQRIKGTYERKEIFETAQSTANKLGKTVTIDAQRGSPDGVHHTFFKVTP